MLEGNSYWTGWFGTSLYHVNIQIQIHTYKRNSRNGCYLVGGGEFSPTALTTTHCVYCLHLILLICAQTYQLSCEIIISDFKGKNPIILYNLGIALGLQCPCAMALKRNRYSWVEVVAVLITLLYLNKCRVILVEVVMLVTVVITAVNSKRRSVWPREGYTWPKMTAAHYLRVI